MNSCASSSNSASCIYHENLIPAVARLLKPADHQGSPASRPQPSVPTSALASSLYPTFPGSFYTASSLFSNHAAHSHAQQRVDGHDRRQRQRSSSRTVLSVSRRHAWKRPNLHINHRRRWYACLHARRSPNSSLMRSHRRCLRCSDCHEQHKEAIPLHSLRSQTANRIASRAKRSCRLSRIHAIRHCTRAKRFVNLCQLTYM